MKINQAPKVIMLCGKIGSGKSTYAEALRRQLPAVVLSSDEIMLALFQEDLGEHHDAAVERTEQYLYRKSLAILEIGVNVILDWGFWRKQKREEARRFYGSRGIACEFHYVESTDPQRKAQIAHRNREVLEGRTAAYFVDEGLAEKCDHLFEMPEKQEMDVWYVKEERQL